MSKANEDYSPEEVTAGNAAELIGYQESNTKIEKFELPRDEQWTQRMN